jgi:hypothetical protein
MSGAGLERVRDTILTLFLSRETGLFKGLCVTRGEKTHAGDWHAFSAAGDGLKQERLIRTWIHSNTSSDIQKEQNSSGG